MSVADSSNSSLCFDKCSYILISVASATMSMNLPHSSGFLNDKIINKAIKEIKGQNMGI